MKIKKLLCVVMTLVFVVGVLGCGSKSLDAKDADDGVYRLIMADVQKGDHPTAVACDKFAEYVKDATKGKVIIEVYHGDILGAEQQQLEQVTVGGVDFARISSPLATYYDDLKALQALFLFDNNDSMWKVLDGEIGQQMLKSEELKKNGIEGLCWLSGGSRNFYNSKKEIKSPSDLKGLNIRVNTTSMFSLLAACGCNGLNVAYNDILNSLKAGVLDGAENNWPSYVATEHYTEAKYITVDEHTRVPEMFIASIETMNSLPQEYQQAIRECAAKASQFQRKAMLEYDEKAIKTAEESGCTITYLTDAQLEEFRKVAEPVNQEVSAKYMTLINKIKAAQK